MLGVPLEGLRLQWWRWQSQRLIPQIGEENKMSSTNPKDLLALPELNSKPYRRLTKAMERSPCCEAKSRSAGQEISRILRQPKFHERVHNSPKLDNNTCQIKTVTIFASNFPVFDLQFYKKRNITNTTNCVELSLSLVRIEFSS